MPPVLVQAVAYFVILVRIVVCRCRGGVLRIGLFRGDELVVVVVPPVDVGAVGVGAFRAAAGGVQIVREGVDRGCAGLRGDVGEAVEDVLGAGDRDGAGEVGGGLQQVGIGQIGVGEGLRAET